MLVFEKPPPSKRDLPPAPFRPWYVVNLSTGLIRVRPWLSSDVYWPQKTRYFLSGIFAVPTATDFTVITSNCC
ncbi:hypothetical protein D3C78_1811150 [compost metagenome]